MTYQLFTTCYNFLLSVSTFYSLFKLIAKKSYFSLAKPFPKVNFLLVYNKDGEPRGSALEFSDFCSLAPAPLSRLAPWLTLRSQAWILAL